MTEGYGRHKLHKIKMGNECIAELHRRAVGIILTRMDWKVVCKRFTISRTVSNSFMRLAEAGKSGKGLKNKATSNSSPGSFRRHGLRTRRMCFTLVSDMPGGIR